MISRIKTKLSGIYNAFLRRIQFEEGGYLDGGVFNLNAVPLSEEAYERLRLMTKSSPIEVIGFDMASAPDFSSESVFIPLADYEIMKRREQDLLEANNRYLNRARASEAIERDHRDARQKAMLEWAKSTFGDIEGCDPVALDERVRRFFEEAVELAHACGMDAVGAAKVLARVFSNPVGSPLKELSQAQMTLSILAEVLGITASDAEIAEFDRVQMIPKAEFERRHRAKMEIGI